MDRAFGEIKKDNEGKKMKNALKRRHCKKQRWKGQMRKTLQNTDRELDKYKIYTYLYIYI